MWNGPLTPRILPFLLRRILTQRKSGGLVFALENRRFAFWIDRQHLIRAKAEWPADGFVAYLQTRNLSDAWTDKFSDVDPGTDPALEDLLFEKGLPDPQILQQHYADYLVYLLQSINRQNGKYHFSTLEKMPAGRTSLPLTEGILQLLRDDVPEDWLTEQLHFAWSGIPLVIAENWKQISAGYRLSAQEGQLLSQCVHPVDLSRLIAEQTSPRKEVLQQVYLLYSLGLLLPESKPAAGGSQETAPAGRCPENNVGKAKGGTEEERLQNCLEGWRHADHYQVLGVAESAGIDDIKNAYHLLAKKYHPDLYSSDSHSCQTKDLVMDLFERVRRAYGTLKDPQSREQYDEERRARSVSRCSTMAMGTSTPESLRSKEPEAETCFQKGLLSIRGKDVDAGLNLLRYAVKLQPENTGYRSTLAKILHSFPNYRKEAEENYLQAIRLEPFRVENHVGLGLLYKEAGLPKKAELQFRNALRYDPENPVVLEELRKLTGVKIPPEKESGSVFNKILGPRTRKD